MSREDAECGLMFGGFAVLSCPLKVDSEQTIKEISESSHNVSDIVLTVTLFLVSICCIASALTVTDPLK